MCPHATDETVGKGFHTDRNWWTGENIMLNSLCRLAIISSGCTAQSRRRRLFLTQRSWVGSIWEKEIHSEESPESTQLTSHGCSDAASSVLLTVSIALHQQVTAQHLRLGVKLNSDVYFTDFFYTLKKCLKGICKTESLTAYTPQAPESTQLWVVSPAEANCEDTKWSAYSNRLSLKAVGFFLFLFPNSLITISSHSCAS